jgi:uridine kinase
MTRDEGVRAACAILRERRVAKTPVTAAIDGGGGAGKSTLAAGIRDALGDRVAIIRCDDFYRPLRDDEPNSSTGQLAFENYFDWQRLRDDALIPLRGGSTARYRRHDWSSDSLAEWIEVAPAEIVIVEGVYSMRPELREFIDLAIFVDSPREERLRRMLARNQNRTTWIERWMSAEDWYLDHIAPMKSADLVVHGF